MFHGLWLINSLTLAHWLWLTSLLAHSFFPGSTCHRVPEFLLFWLSGFLVFWSSDSDGSASHSVALHSLALCLPRMGYHFLWNRYYCTCCCSSGKTMTFHPQIFAFAHNGCTSIEEIRLEAGSNVTAQAICLNCFFLHFFTTSHPNWISDASKIRHAVVWRKVVRSKQISTHFTVTF